MKVVGKTKKGAAEFQLASDAKRVARYHFDRRVRVPKLTALLDGLGSGGVVALTVTGNEITDAIRAAALSGDGRAPLDSSFGLWDASTNLLANGGFESNITGWSAASATVTRDTSTSKFGVACQKRVGTVAAANQYAWAAVAITGATAGRIFTASCWVKGEGSTIGKMFGMTCVEVGGAQPANTSQVNVILTGEWQRVVVTRTIVQNDRTSLSTEPHLNNGAGNTAVGDVHYVDGVQVEEKSLATPYIETNGAPATRAFGRVLGPSPAAVITPTTGWVAARVRMGFDSAAPGVAASRRIVNFGSSATERILLYYSTTAVTFQMQRDSGASSAAAVVASGAFAAGAEFTVVGKWDATGLYVSVNGGAFVFAAATAVPTLDTIFDIGSIGGGGNWDGDILWLATGTGSPSNADAAALHAYGNTDPSRLAELPQSPTFLWKANNADAVVPGPVGTQALKGIIYSAAGTKLAESAEVVVASGQPWGAVDFSFATPGGIVIPAAGDYDLGVIAGGPLPGVARLSSDYLLNGLRRNVDTYSDGAASAFGAATIEPYDLSVFATFIDEWAAPANVDDLYLSRLPFPEAQAVFGQGGVVKGSAQRGACGWHGTKLDTERGSVVLVAADGAFADLVGERLKITHGSGPAARTVYVYCHTEATLDEGFDLSLPRRMFTDLAPLSLTSIRVRAEVMA